MKQEGKLKPGLLQLLTPPTTTDIAVGCRQEYLLRNREPGVSAEPAAEPDASIKKAAPRESVPYEKITAGGETVQD